MISKLAVAAALVATAAAALGAPTLHAPHRPHSAHGAGGSPHRRGALSSRMRHGFMHSPPKGSEAKFDPLPDQWFQQTLDHFDPQNNSTFPQRYFVNNAYYTSGGPVFIMLGGEGTANPIWLQDQTQMVVWAQQFGALMFCIEHRFYGNTQPFADLSTPNLAYLTSEQALADVATFHDGMVELFQLPPETPWISFGGSYSGALSAWLRLKYPHIVVAAVASSAPVFPELDFYQYLEVVTASLTTLGSDACVAQISQATAELTPLLSTAAGRAQLTTQFQLCAPLSDDPLDIANFVSSAAGNFENVVQYNGDNRAFEGAVDTNVTIPVLCGLMNDEGVSDLLQRYANVNSLVLQTYSEPCLDASYADMIAGLQNITLEAGLSGGRQWIYQTCTEFGWYQTSDSSKQPFGSGFGLPFSVQQCADIYGPAFTQTEIESGISWTRSNYGGYGLSGTNIVLPNGSIDPWHAMGILQDLSPTVNAVFIQGTAHCADMYPADANDSANLLTARETIQSHLAEWLAPFGIKPKTPVTPLPKRHIRVNGRHM